MRSWCFSELEVNIRVKAVGISTPLWELGLKGGRVASIALKSARLGLRTKGCELALLDVSTR